MKEVPLSTCEKNSVIGALQAGLRLDGRGFMEVRDVSVDFGKDFGCCTVSVGQTRVLAQVTCEVVEPRPSRPNEGKLSIAVHLSPMAAPHFETGRGYDLVDELQQILDRNIKESRCVDIESLCIVAEESVWQFRVDVTVLNHAGNLCDACNIAAVAALRHFHRPDVSVEEDGRVTIHTLEEREPIPTFLKKVPVCLTYAFFLIDDQFIILMDPTDLEERVMSGKLIVGLNPHGEITSIVFPGKLCLQKEQIMSCIQNAFGKAKSIAEMVQDAVEEELKAREVKCCGFTTNLKSDFTYALEKIQDRIQGQLHRGNEIIGDEVECKEIKAEMQMEESDEEFDIEKENYSSAQKDTHAPEIKEESDEEFEIEKRNKTSRSALKVRHAPEMKEESDEEFEIEKRSRSLNKRQKFKSRQQRSLEK